MRDLLRRFVGWLFVPRQLNDALAALDGGPGPELPAPDPAGNTSPTGDDGAGSLAYYCRQTPADYREFLRHRRSWQDEAAEAFADAARAQERRL